MKKIASFLFVALCILLAVVVTPVLALGAHLQESPPQPTAIEFLVQLIFGLVLTVPGFTMLGVVVVNLLKIPGWVKDGNAQVALNIFNVGSAVVIGILALFAPNVNIIGLDESLGRIAATLTVLLPTFVLLFKWLAPHFYDAIRGFPLLGYSYSLAKSHETAL